MANAKPSAKIITPVGRLAFQSLFTPAVNKLNPNAPAKYETIVVFDKDADISAIEAIVAEASKNVFGTEELPEGAYNPIRDASEKAKHGEPFTSGGKMIKVKSQFAPGIVDAKLQPIIDSSEIYPGVFAMVQIHAYGYDNATQGVGFGLDNVQKRADGPAADGRIDAASAFDAVADEDLL
jgi:hypothetical protein